ncbi:MAG: sulfotransferase [Phycisphaerales bacterium]
MHRRPTPPRPQRQSRPGAPPPNLTKSRALHAYEKRDFRTALRLATEAAAKSPRDFELYHLMGSCMAKLGSPASALDLLEKAAKLQPRHPGVLISLAQTYRTLQRFDEMDAAIDRALASAPDLPDALHLRATSLRDRGRYDEALRIITPAIDKGSNDPNFLIAHAEICAATRDAEPGIASARKVLDLPNIRPNVRRAAWFLLGSLLDSAKRYDEAFEAFTQGNALVEAKDDAPKLDTVSRWSAERLASIPFATKPCDLPVLVVGMPRSGTTLVEQMLAAHPKIGTVGESHTLPALRRAHNPANLDQRTIDELQARYLAELAKAGDAVERVVDKLPGNYINLGLASRITPGARAIHCLRDPRDTCLSCYFQNFGDAHSYSRDLALCAAQYAEHLRIMDHWRATLDMPILDVHYADLVADPEAGVRRMLDFVGLEFDEACLRFYESNRSVTTLSSAQVRRPVYTSSLARWKRYESHLAPLIEALRANGVPLDEDAQA